MADMHFHPRDDDVITQMVMRHLWESGFRMGIPILNYREPIDTAWKLEKEQKRLTKIAPNFNFIWSMMLTKNSTPEGIKDASSIGAKVIKWIPEKLSTNSSHYGINWEELPKKYDCFEAGNKEEMRGMTHVEASYYNRYGKPITHPLYREHLAIPKFDALAKKFPGILFTFEHVSSKEGVEYILNEAPPNVFGTITGHHLIGKTQNVYKVRDGKEIIVPEKWCMPVFKRRQDREALRKAAMSGSGKFFYGGDKAPHQNKAPQNPPAGIYSGITDISVIADIFSSYGAPANRLNDFMSGFGPDHYGVPRSKGTFTLKKEDWIAPEEVNGVKIFCGGKNMKYKTIF